MSLFLSLLLILGLLSLAKFAASFLYYAYAFFLRPAKPLKSRYGPWAVVTGSTDGIGKGVAFELARNNLNLILVGRSPSKLHSVSTSLKNRHPSVEVKTVVFDLAGDLPVGLQALAEAIEGVDVGVLVNNAGVAHPNSFYFHEDEMELYMEMVKVNLVALTEITGAVLRGMLERGRGAIVNIGSGGAAVIPSYPLFSVYAATKA